MVTGSARCRRMARYWQHGKRFVPVNNPRPRLQQQLIKFSRSGETRPQERSECYSPFESLHRKSRNARRAKASEHLFIWYASNARHFNNPRRQNDVPACNKRGASRGVHPSLPVAARPSPPAARPDRYQPANKRLRFVIQLPGVNRWLTATRRARTHRPAPRFSAINGGRRCSVPGCDKCRLNGQMDSGIDIRHLIDNSGLLPPISRARIFSG